MKRSRVPQLRPDTAKKKKKKKKIIEKNLQQRKEKVGSRSQVQSWGHTWPALLSARHRGRYTTTGDQGCAEPWVVVSPSHGGAP